jgi:hypothetical protein
MREERIEAFGVLQLTMRGEIVFFGQKSIKKRHQTDPINTMLVCFSLGLLSTLAAGWQPFLLPLIGLNNFV